MKKKQSLTEKTNIPEGKRFPTLFAALQNTPIPDLIRTLNHLSLEDFREHYAKKSHPFILNETALEKGSDLMSQMIASFADKIIKVRVGDYANPEHYAPERRKLVEMKLKEYADALHAVDTSSDIPPPYAGNFSLPIEYLQKMGLGMPRFFSEGRFELPTIWLGAKGSITPLHKDSTDNFARQIVGKKTWRIFPPQDAHCLSLRHNPASAGGDFATSDIDLRSVDHKKFPEFLKARSFTIELGPGQLLYLPAGWSHYVENLENSLMINYWLSPQPSGIYALDQI